MHTASPESVGMSSDRLNNIQSRLKTYIDNKNTAGFISLVARKGKVIHYETSGLRDVENQLPMEKDTIFRIYSMTKPITSIALMMLYEQGKFQLFDPVSKFIPEFGKTKVLNRMGYLGEELVEQDPPMTIQHLLTHTAGLSYGFFYDSPIEESYRNSKFRDPNTTPEEKIKDIARIPLRFQPGTCWHYSVATDVCGYLVQVISGMPFATFLQENIFNPLGMVDTHFHVPAEKVNRFAALYRHDISDGSMHEWKGAPDIPFHDFTKPTKAPSGGGGLVSTTEDYYRFAQMLLNKGDYEGTRIIGRKTLEFMSTNHLDHKLLPIELGLNVKKGKGFGLGFEVELDPGQSAVIGSVGNYGWGGAASTNFWIDPKEDLLGIIMTQLMHNVLPFQFDFRTTVYQALVD